MYTGNPTHYILCYVSLNLTLCSVIMECMTALPRDSQDLLPKNHEDDVSERGQQFSLRVRWPLSHWGSGDLMDVFGPYLR